MRAVSGSALFCYELPSPTSSHASEVRSATRSARDRHVFTHIQRSTHHSSPCLRGKFIAAQFAMLVFCRMVLEEYQTVYRAFLPFSHESSFFFFNLK